MGGGAEELCEKVISVTCRKNGPIITDNYSSVWHVGEMAGGRALPARPPPPGVSASASAVRAACWPGGREEQGGVGVADGVGR